MKTGIYALYWEKPSLVYIGLSQDIESRFTEHLYKMRNNTHTNYKVQDTYKKYGNPELVILEICTYSQLNTKEIEWTKEFDSINAGLNIIEAGRVGWGVNSNASKYTKMQILKVFSLLYRTNQTAKSISNRAGVTESCVCDISNGSTHLWLQEKYPEKWKLATRSRQGLRHLNIIKAVVISPSGEEIPVRWSRDLFNHPLLCTKNYESTRPSINKLLDGRLKSYLGFKLKNNASLV